ncbi:hypothetical protein BDV96DRAFT_601485 [Lophiotrema nucula]|uniref:Uncharacterized protein n=1 Tax=Lophiotrema nucula TaxID=690887 RepID=A0A6A5Z1K2_9PLEO|nr:hypothetical protein BDV96DRAFT_601485 [Lophiotrema nucula]
MLAAACFRPPATRTSSPPSHGMPNREPRIRHARPANSGHGAKTPRDSPFNSSKSFRPLAPYPTQENRNCTPTTSRIPSQIPGPLIASIFPPGHNVASRSSN